MAANVFRYGIRAWWIRSPDKFFAHKKEEAKTRLLRTKNRLVTVKRLLIIDCPLLYLRASDDRLIKSDSWRAIREISGNAVCIEIDGPHFILQAKPEQCAVAIK